MQNILGKVSLEQAKEALLRSGYLLENRLDTILQRKGFLVEANTAYPDPEIGKSRELDIYGMSAIKAGPNEFDWVFSVLLIECINNPQPVAFITKEPQLGFLHHHQIKLSGLPVKIIVNNRPAEWESLPDFLGMEKYHHYCKGRVATQFCSFVKKKSGEEWMAFHDETHFDCFRKLSAASEYFSERHFQSWTFGDNEPINIEFYYPIVVLQGELLDIRASKTSLKVVKTDHIQYRRAAIVGNEETQYQIDVITERYFSRYLALVEREVSKTARLLRRRHATIRKSINKISRSAARLRSPEKIKAEMEF